LCTVRRHKDPFTGEGVASAMGMLHAGPDGAPAARRGMVALASMEHKGPLPAPGLKNASMIRRPPANVKTLTFPPHTRRASRGSNGRPCHDLMPASPPRFPQHYPCAT